MEYRFSEYKKPEILRGHLHLGGENPKGERIGINSRYLTRNHKSEAEKPWIGIMGEIHYVRCKRARWKEILSKMKAGGITVVSTYALWIYHEEEEGVYDFDGVRDVRSFVQLCGEMGFDVVMRIGPWFHGEVRNGGFPDWLVEKPFPLRDVNTDFMAAAEKWYRALNEQLQGLYYKDGGNIIAVQIENEFVDNEHYLSELKKLAVRCGIVAPIYTVTAWNRPTGAKIPVDEVLPLFGGYCDAPWEDSTEKLPPSVHYFFTGVRNETAIRKDLSVVEEKDGEGWLLPYERYPFATCEIGGGLHSTYLRRYQIQGMDIYAVALIKLGEGTNLIGYYMYYGGENLLGKHTTLQETKATGYPNDYPILNYDFEAPISQYGEIRDHYRLLNLLHLFITDFQESLAEMSFVPATEQPAREDKKTLRYGMRTDGTHGYVFVNHYQRLDILEDVEDVVFSVGDVTFPAINVSGPMAFFLPFHMNLSGVDLSYATAQPLCRMENTYFFMSIPGIIPRYCINGEEIPAGIKGHGFSVGDIRIVTLSFEEALYIRRLEGKLYIGEGCDLYIQEGRLLAAQPGMHKAFVWNGETFAPVTVSAMQEEDCGYRLTEVAAPPFTVKEELLSEFWFGGEPKLHWYRIETEGETGFVDISIRCDVMQLYADMELAADGFYRGARSDCRQNCCMEKNVICLCRNGTVTVIWRKDESKKYVFV